MRKNTSPWLHQLDVERVPYILSQDSAADVVIVGAGIAGIATAFEILTTTQKSLLILERSRLAHGATGHNAGQVVGHFERGLKSLVDEFGLAPAIAGQQAIEGAWETLHHMYRTAGLDIPFFEFVGHTGFTSEAQVLLRLENNRLRVKGGLEPELLEIADSAQFVARIPPHYADLYTVVPSSTIQHLLETERTDFVAVLSYRKGCINSALFCEEMVRFFVRRYHDRCTLFEHTPAHKIILRHDSALIDCVTNFKELKRVSKAPIKTKI